MVTEPRLTPLTSGCVAGVVAPAVINTVGDTVALVVSLLLSVTVTPPAGAACGSVTVNAAEWASPTVTFDCRLIPPPGTTVTLAVVLAMEVALALITMLLPAVTPVTGTLTLVAPAANVTVAGTVATAGLAELRFTIRPAAGAGPDRVSVRFCVVGPMMVRLFGEKPMVAVT
jgi:hypothetical protein